MMRDFSEKDWKLFRKKLPGWQEAYMNRLCREYIDLLSSDIKASNRFWELEKRIKDDRKKTGVVATMSRSKMIFNIVNLVYDGAISMDDLEEFSDDVKESVRMLLRMEE
jgi:hypothetical protein